MTTPFERLQSRLALQATATDASPAVDELARFQRIRREEPPERGLAPEEALRVYFKFSKAGPPIAAGAYAMHTLLRVFLVLSLAMQVREDTKNKARGPRVLAYMLSTISQTDPLDRLMAVLFAIALEARDTKDVRESLGSNVALLPLLPATINTARAFANACKKTIKATVSMVNASPALEVLPKDALKIDAGLLLQVLDFARNAIEPTFGAPTPTRYLGARSFKNMRESVDERPLAIMVHSPQSTLSSLALEMFTQLRARTNVARFAVATAHGGEADWTRSLATRYPTFLVFKNNVRVFEQIGFDPSDPRLNKLREAAEAAAERLP